MARRTHDDGTGVSHLGQNRLVGCFQYAGADSFCVEALRSAPLDDPRRNVYVREDFHAAGGRSMLRPDANHDA